MSPWIKWPNLKRCTKEELQPLFKLNDDVQRIREERVGGLASDNSQNGVTATAITKFIGMRRSIVNTVTA